MTNYILPLVRSEGVITTFESEFGTSDSFPTNEAEFLEFIAKFSQFYNDCHYVATVSNCEVDQKEHEKQWKLCCEAWDNIYTEYGGDHCVTSYDDLMTYL